MKWAKLAKAALCLLVFFLPVKANAEEPFTGFDQFIESAMKQWNIPGASVAVVVDGKITCVRGYGKRSAMENQEVDRHTIFSIGSLTKAFTSALAAQLVDSRKIRWDDKLCKYLPDLDLYDPWISHEITLRDVLSNRTGLNDPGFMWWGSGFTPEEIQKHFKNLHPTGPFRSRYAYNNVGFMLAGQCIAKSVGKSWQDQIAEKIFLPLSMKESTTSISRLDGYTNVASPHRIVNEKPEVIPAHNIDNIAPAGAICSSADDMANWLLMQLSEGSFESRQIVAKDTLRETHTPQILTGQAQVPPDYMKPFVDFGCYCMGWATNTYRGHKVLWHSGAIDGMHSTIGLVPEKKSGIVLLTNLDQRDQNATTAILHRCFDSFLGLEPADWLPMVAADFKERKEKQAQKEKELDDSLPKKGRPHLSLSGYAGRYESKLYGVLEVKEAASGAEMPARLGVMDGVMKHRVFDTFRFIDNKNIGDPEDFTFVFDESGKPEAVRCDDLGWFSKIQPHKN